MSLKLAARLVAVDPYKIADLQENDTATHIEDLSAVLPPETKGILIQATRSSGSGGFKVYSRSGSIAYQINASSHGFLCIKNQELKWQNSVANDDWDIYLLGYFVQKRTR